MQEEEVKIYGEKASDKDAEAFIKLADTNLDGKVDYEEFRKLMRVLCTEDE